MRLSENKIAKPNRNYTEDEICELVFGMDYRTVRNSFGEGGSYRRMIEILQGDFEVELIENNYYVKVGNFNITINQEHFDKMYRLF